MSDIHRGKHLTDGTRERVEVGREQAADRADAEGFDRRQLARIDDEIPGTQPFVEIVEGERRVGGAAKGGNHVALVLG
ncbi:MAG: hypothetical protein DMF97_20375, partial [Acidobacteria bacterium]